MYNNILIPTDGGRQSRPARYRLGQANQRQSHGTDGVAAFSYADHRCKDDRRYAGSVQSCKIPVLVNR